MLEYQPIMNKRSKYNNLINLFYEIGSLRKMKRSYILHMLQDVESVAEHSHRVILIAYFLSKEVKADPYKTMLMAAFHDLSETRTGDANWHQKEYVTHDEAKAQEAQFSLMGNPALEIKEILNEYHERKSLESKIAKDADNVDYILNLKELELQGNLEAKRRLNSKDVSKRHLYTDLAKRMFDDLLKSKPNDWYSNDRMKTYKKYVVKKSGKKN